MDAAIGVKVVLIYCDAVAVIRQSQTAPAEIYSRLSGSFRRRYVYNGNVFTEKRWLIMTA